MLKILGTESLGVRSLSCVVEVENRKIVVDPGLALGYRRHGLLPHPAQVAVGEQVRRKILAELRDATDLCRMAKLWTKGPQGLSENTLRRRQSLGKVLGTDLPGAEGQRDGPLAFSLPVPHGRPNTKLGAVMMTRIQWGDTVFVHASDIQLLDGEAASLILDWQPDIVLASGPPLYLPWLSSEYRETAWENARRLACHVDTLILDHHLLRCEEGLSWLDRLSSETGHRVICAADFMERPRRLLEAKREQLYEEMPVPEGWHKAYARGDADTRGYRDYISIVDVT